MMENKNVLIKKSWLSVGILSLLCVIVSLFSTDNQRVEVLYSTSFYPTFSKILRSSFCWLPFSFGDLLYGILVIYLGLKIFRTLKIIFSKTKRKLIIENWQQIIISIIKKFALLFLVFYLFWGINYSRVGIASQLDLKIEKYSIDELKHINQILVDKINASKQSLLNQKFISLSSSEMFSKTENAYDLAAKKYPFLVYRNKSIKTSLWGWLGNYVGFLGYYNPFTGEAQVNTTGPKFMQPYTTCHEVAHQLGYAKEMEANFVGYLAAAASADTIFKYSMYTDLFTYANRTLYIADSASSLFYRKLLTPEVIKDFKEKRKFYAAHTSFIEPAIRYLYGKFLEQNQQPMGILSYDEVTAFIIAYHKKYKEI